MRKKFERGDQVIAKGRFGTVSDVNYGRTCPEIAVDHVLSDNATTETVIYPEYAVLLAGDRVTGGVKNVTTETPRAFQIGDIVIVNGRYAATVRAVDPRVGEPDQILVAQLGADHMEWVGSDELMVVRQKKHDNITADSVNHPSHYSSLDPEPIDVITAWNLDFCLGNAVKYISRWEAKGGVEDLQKAVWYLQRKLEMVERE